MSDNKRSGSFFAGKGYYIALVLCAAAIGITSYVYSANEDKVQEAAVQETYEDVLAGTMGDAGDVAVIATQPQPQTQPAPTPAAGATTPAPAEKKPMKTMSPVSGEAVFGYSMEALSYNQTTRDWRVHNGIDLAAEAGTQVVAAADGEVSAVFEDESLGHTVVIRHDSGYTTSYSCLMEEISVKPGDQVTMGTVIGCAGDTAIVETTLGSHIHFSVSRYDEPMDPAAFLALGQ
nr:M23 family metallopeptidase [Oscillospiraceae bacterium]